MPSDTRECHEIEMHVRILHFYLHLLHQLLSMVLLRVSPMAKLFPFGYIGHPRYGVDIYYYTA